MKKLINHKIYVSINGDDYLVTSIRDYLEYSEPKETKEYNFNNFKQLYTFLEKAELIGITADKSFILREPVIRINCPEIRDEAVLHHNNFKNIKILDVYYEYDEHITIRELSNSISAEEFVEWLKDRNIDKLVL